MERRELVEMKQLHGLMMDTELIPIPYGLQVVCTAFRKKRGERLFHLSHYADWTRKQEQIVLAIILCVFIIFRMQKGKQHMD